MKPSDNSQALEAIANHQERKEQVVFTNGYFDILHIGHARYLEEAKALGDVLVVGLNSDSSVMQLKGLSRPIVPEAERKEMLQALRSVDYVCIFEEKNPLKLIQKISPDILVKGGDWPKEKIVGSEFVEAAGGQVLSLPFVPGHSTSELVQKIQKL